MSWWLVELVVSQYAAFSESANKGHWDINTNSSPTQCLNALSCCHVVAWLETCINNQLDSLSFRRCIKKMNFRLFSMSSSGTSRTQIENHTPRHNSVVQKYAWTKCYFVTFGVKLLCYSLFFPQTLKMTPFMASSKQGAVWEFMFSVVCSFFFCIFVVLV